jgi:hypothetical protein
VDQFRTAPQLPLLVTPTQVNFRQSVRFHHFDELLQLVEIEWRITRRYWIRHVKPL